MKSRFSLADLFIVAGTLLFGFFSFLSFNFLSLGDTKSSIIRATVYALLLGISAFGAKLLKRTARPSKAKVVGEGILLLFFVIVAIIAIFPFSHYFTVSDKKADIQKELTVNIEQATDMFNHYKDYTNNRLNMYRNNLNAIVAAKNVNPREYKSYGFVSGTDNNTQIENKIFTLKAMLEPSNYEEMKQIASAWLLNAKNEITDWNIITDWNPIGIVYVVNEVNNKTTSWKNELKQFSEYRAQGETATDFDYTLTFNDVTDKIRKTNSLTPFSISISIGLYVLMLLSYIFTRRHSKNSYSLFSIFIKKKSADRNTVDIPYP